MIAVTADPAIPIPDLEALRALATRVINEHVDDSSLCAVCGSAFPCGLAVLAEHNLGLVRDTRGWPFWSGGPGR